MLDFRHIYVMLKPTDSGVKITDYDVIMGGTRYAGDYNKGLIIISLVNTQVLTSSSKRFVLKDDDFDINESSLIQYNFQLDCYKRNSENATEIEAFNEAIKVQEWLKSYYVREYLAKKNAQILPNYANIAFTNELIDGVFINRAIFEFSIIHKVEISEADIGLTPKLKDNKIL